MNIYVKVKKLSYMPLVIDFGYTSAAIIYNKDLKVT